MTFFLCLCLLLPPPPLSLQKLNTPSSLFPFILSGIGCHLPVREGQAGLVLYQVRNLFRSQVRRGRRGAPVAATASAPLSGPQGRLPRCPGRPESRCLLHCVGQCLQALNGIWG